MTATGELGGGEGAGAGEARGGNGEAEEAEAGVGRGQGLPASRLGGRSRRDDQEAAQIAAEGGAGQRTLTLEPVREARESLALLHTEPGVDFPLAIHRSNSVDRGLSERALR